MSMKYPPIRFNDRLFEHVGRAHDEAVVQAVSRGDVNGFYDGDRAGVLLLDVERRPFAFASANDGGFLVTAGATPEGRVRYMYGLASYTEVALGITGHRHGAETATSILSQYAAATKETAAPDVDQGSQPTESVEPLCGIGHP